jgi:hypothetical protein
LYQGIFWFIFVSTIGIFIKDWAWYKENAMYRTNKKIRDARNKKKYWMAFGVFFFGVFTYLSDLSMVIVCFIVINQFVVWFLRVD